MDNRVVDCFANDLLVEIWDVEYERPLLHWDFSVPNVNVAPQPLDHQEKRFVIFNTIVVVYLCLVVPIFQ